jgi:hypothetical protein
MAMRRRLLDRWVGLCRKTRGSTEPARLSTVGRTTAHSMRRVTHLWIINVDVMLFFRKGREREATIHLMKTL